MPEERLQKILSRAGAASRRKAEQLILEGRAAVNGAVVIEMGSSHDWHDLRIPIEETPRLKNDMPVVSKRVAKA